MSDRKESDIFISYAWAIGHHVDELYSFLDFHNYSVWMDRKCLLAGSQLTHEIQKGILGAEVFLFCINRDYLTSQMCEKEIHYASRLKKKMIAVFFDDLSEIELEKLEPTISASTKIYAFKSLGDLTGNVGTQLLQAVQQALKRT